MGTPFSKLMNFRPELGRQQYFSLLSTTGAVASHFFDSFKGLYMFFLCLDALRRVSRMLDYPRVAFLRRCRP